MDRAGLVVVVGRRTLGHDLVDQLAEVVGGEDQRQGIVPAHVFVLASGQVAKEPSLGFDLGSGGLDLGPGRILLLPQRRQHGGVVLQFGLVVLEGVLRQEQVLQRLRQFRLVQRPVIPGLPTAPARRVAPRPPPTAR